MELEAVLFGGLAGFFVAGAGYLKSMKEEDFEPLKFMPTVILGGLTGSLIAFTGFTQDVAVLVLSTSGITHLVESSAKIIWRNLFG